VNIPDAEADQRSNQSVDLATGFATCSLLCVVTCNNCGETVNSKDGCLEKDDKNLCRNNCPSSTTRAPTKHH
jgi:hypothetical protein